MRAVVILALVLVFSPPPHAWGAARSYAYDADGRIVGEDHGGGQVVTYTYDANGNRTSWHMTGPTPSPTADVSVVKTASPSPVPAGSHLTYSIVVSNAGPHPATGVRVSDALPGVVLSISESFAQGTISVDGGALTWAVGILGSNAASTLTLVVRPVIQGAVTNEVVVSAVPADPNGQNNTSIVVTAVSVPANSDDDLMPDWWEAEHFGGPTNATSTADSDADGVTEEGEFLADTDPRDPASFLSIEEATPVPTPVRIGWPTSPVRTYRLQATENLAGGSWSNLATGIPGSGSLKTVLDTNPPPARLYRVGAELP